MPRYYSLWVVEGVRREAEEMAVNNRKGRSWKGGVSEREEGETSPLKEFVSTGIAMEQKDGKRY